jgi:hypothetical protein
MTKRIDEETLAILSQVTTKDSMCFLPDMRLDRKQYKAVNDVLENMGGKWNKKGKCHIFPEDPTDKLEQVLLSGEIVQPKKYGYFPTPPDLAKKLIDLAGIETGMTVLEPSAGQGGIADFILTNCFIDCVELLPENAKVLGKRYKTLCTDFLSVDPSELYDRVVMNPPFEKQADIDHVVHAWKCVKHGGKLVSIMSSGVMFRENRKTVEFRRLVDEYGYFERLPEGSFKESGTMVNTCIVVMDKP